MVVPAPAEPPDAPWPHGDGVSGPAPPDLAALLERMVSWHQGWQAGFGAPAPRADQPPASRDAVVHVLDELTARLEENFPTFHAGYAGHMTRPPHDVAVAGYLAAMLINPNAINWDSGPATVRMEHEVVDQLARMTGFTGRYLGHLTTGGTSANLEALYVARERRPGTLVAYSDQAHYTHARVCRTLGVRGVAVPSDDRGRMDVDALRQLLRRAEVGVVVATVGTTGLGAVDPVHEIVPTAREHGALVHVDAAYGGYFALLARSPGPASPLVDLAPWAAVADADSIVVDPHKHGLQPYGCGSVIYRDPDAHRFLTDYTSPYLDFDSPRVALAQASLECSRAGAATAALWATTRLFPLVPGGAFAETLAASRRAALRWASRLESSPVLRLHQQPELDVVTYFDGRPGRTSQINTASDRVLRRGRDAGAPVFVTQLVVPAAQFAARHPDVLVDTEEVRVLRSVLIKPSHEQWADHLVGRLEALAGSGPRCRRVPDHPADHHAADHHADGDHADGEPPADEPPDGGVRPEDDGVVTIPIRRMTGSLS